MLAVGHRCAFAARARCSSTSWAVIMVSFRVVSGSSGLCTMVYRLDGVGSQKGAALLSLYNVPQYCNAGPRCPTPTSILLLPLRKQSHWCHCPAAQLLD